MLDTGSYVRIDPFYWSDKEPPSLKQYLSCCLNVFKQREKLQLNGKKSPINESTVFIFMSHSWPDKFNTRGVFNKTKAMTETC